MPKSNVSLISSSLAVFVKDVRLELRSRYALNAILMFGITTLVVVSYSVGQSGLDSHLQAALFWVIIFFSAMSGLSQVFVREEENGTAVALRLMAEAEPIFIGKLAYNFSLLSLLVAIMAPAFFVVTDVSENVNIGAFALLLSLGVVGLCSATTIVAAIIARAAVRGTLFAVLSFPILMPLLLTLVSGTAIAFEGRPVGDMAAEIQFLAAYPVVMIAGSVMLFRFVWHD